MLETDYDDDLIRVCVEVENQEHQRSSTSSSSSPSTSQLNQIGRGAVKRSADADVSSNVKRPRHEKIASTANDKVLCDICNVLITKRYFTSHAKSSTHKNNTLKAHGILGNVSVIASAFKQRVISYKIKSKDSSETIQTPELFLESIKSEIFYLINEAIKLHSSVKINCVLHADFTQETKNIFNSFDFQTCNFILTRADDLNMFLTSLQDTLSDKISSFEKKDSGWSLTKIDHIELNINKCNPLRG